MQTLIENVNIINPFEEIKTNQNVLIEDNLIKEISSDKIKADAVIDGEDNYLLSGFIDCHTHIFAKGFHKEENMANPLGLHFYNAVPHSLQTINAGVTTIRDCGSADLSFKLAQEKKLFTAPKIHLSITPLVMTGGHFDLFLPSGWDMEIIYPGFPKGRCDGIEEVLKKTREVKRAGADFIKVMASGGVLTTNSSPEFAQFNKKELKTIVDEARANDMKVSAHCHSLKGMNNCISAGFSSIEHGTFIDRKTSKRMAEKDVSLVPTLLVHQFLYKNGFPQWDGYAAEKTRKLKEIVKVHKENISVEEISAACNISPAYLHKIFKNTLSITPGNYLLNIRISAAQNLLVNTHQSLIEIAFNCGFNSQSYFSDCFKKNIGVTPKDFRKNATYTL